MNTELLCKKKDFVHAYMSLFPDAVLENYVSAFEIEYTHNSTAIEGNTLSLMETKLLIDAIESGGDIMFQE